MKDNFSKQSEAYAAFRPHYPDVMISHLMAFVKNRESALDTATGNGQLAQKLSPYFEKVYATDISEKQVEKAGKADNIIYKVERAEETTFSDHQFDLVTVAQSIHWFDFDKFYKEIYRILKPDGIFAVLGYGLFSTNPDSDKILMDYYHNIVGPYWDAERKYVEEMYETIPFPFEELPTEKFANNFEWTFGQLIGYLETWSATQHYKNANGSDPVDQIRNELQQSWENGNKKVVFPLILRVGKLKHNSL